MRTSIHHASLLGAIVCLGVLATLLRGMECGAAPSPARPAPSPAQSVRQVAAGMTGFGWRLFDRLAGERAGQNVFLSPASISLALAMTYNGAGGDTAAAMAKTLGLDGLTREQMNAGTAALLADLAANTGTRLAIANSLWADVGSPLRPDFIERNRRAFQAELANVKLTDPAALARINAWVKQKTEQRIPTILNPGDLTPESMLVLLNAIYFKGAWAARFDKAKTKPQPFTTEKGTRKQVPMMTQDGEYRYFADSKMQVIDLRYDGGRVSMYVILPRPGVKVAALRKELAGRGTKWLPGLETAKGTLLLPRFRVSFEAKLNEPLKAMGMGRAFTQAADFRPMFAHDNGWIGLVRHKAFVDVAEDGTEATAATVVVMLKEARIQPAPEFRMVVDHPFLVAIRDGRTGALLFLGQVMEP